MSYVFIAPEMIMAAAADLGRFGAGLVSGNAAAVAATTAVMAVGADASHVAYEADLICDGARFAQL